MRARLTKLAGAAAEAAGRGLRGARFLPAIGAGACLVVAGALVHPALGWLAGCVSLVMLDRRMP